MPNLPTLFVPAGATFDRLMAAFHGSPDEYKEWLREAVRLEMERRELAAIDEQSRLAQRARREELADFLDSAT